MLEAETLIDDALADSGHAISSQTTSFQNAVLWRPLPEKSSILDSSIYIRFSTPLDCMGNKVNSNGDSLSPLGNVINRKDHICDANGNVIPDPQRDKMYTERLASKLIEAFQKDSIVLPTHLVARAAWFTQPKGTSQLFAPFQIALLAKQERTINTSTLLVKITNLVEQVHIERPSCLTFFLRCTIGVSLSTVCIVFHSEHAIEQEGRKVVINAKLAYYYGNRLAHLPLRNVRAPHENYQNFRENQWHKQLPHWLLKPNQPKLAKIHKAHLQYVGFSGSTQWRHLTKESDLVIFTERRIPLLKRSRRLNLDLKIKYWSISGIHTSSLQWTRDLVVQSTPVLRVGTIGGARLTDEVLTHTPPHWSLHLNMLP